MHSFRAYWICTVLKYSMRSFRNADCIVSRVYSYVVMCFHWLLRLLEMWIYRRKRLESRQSMEIERAGYNSANVAFGCDEQESRYLLCDSCYFSMFCLFSFYRQLFSVLCSHGRVMVSSIFGSVVHVTYYDFVWNWPHRRTKFTLLQIYQKPAALKDNGNKSNSSNSSISKSITSNNNNSTLTHTYIHTNIHIHIRKKCQKREE